MAKWGEKHSFYRAVSGAKETWAKLSPHQTGGPGAEDTDAQTEHRIEGLHVHLCGIAPMCITGVGK